MAYALKKSNGTATPPLSTSDLNRRALAGLRRRWAGVTLLYIVVIGLIFWRLATVWQVQYAGRWLVLASIVAVRELWLLWSSLPANHREDEERLLPTLGYGTALTIGRGLAIVLLAGFIFSPRPPGWWAWLPALLYTIGAIFDFLDGYVARITNHATKLGEHLDMEFDVVGIFAAVLLAISYGQLPVWYLLLGLAREIFLFGHWTLRKMGRPVYDLPPSADRRLTAGLQMGFLCVVLWPVFSPPATTVAALLFAIPMVISFGRDWLVTSGMMRQESQQYRRIRAVAKQILEQWVPLVARLVGTIAGLRLLVASVPLFDGWLAHAAQIGLNIGAPALWLIVVLSAVALVFFAAGIVGRLVAIVLIALASWDVLAAGFYWPTNGLLLASAIIVLQLGSGAFALWQPEEALLRHRAGDRRMAN